MRMAYCVTAAAIAALVLTATARAQTYPVKAVRIIVPVAPGGGTDPQARLMARKFQESMGQPFVVENRTGAASMIGTEFVVKAPADGYTLLCAASSLAGAYTLRKDLSFDMLKDLAPVGQISSTATFLVVHASVPASSVKEFIALAKKQGGKMNAGSGGSGSANHLTLEMFKQRAGIQATHIPYKGSGPATIALMSGEVDFSFAGALTSLPHLRSGRIKALAVTTPRPSAADAGRADAGIALSGLRGDQLVWHIRAGGNARGCRQQDQPRNRSRDSASGCARVHGEGRRRSGRQHASGIRRVFQKRSGPLCAGDPVREYSGRMR